MPRPRALPGLVAALALFVCYLSISCDAKAQPPTVRQGSLEIDTPWARATPPAARTGAAYFTISNHGATPDRLVAAKSTAAAQVELHAHVNEGGVMRMKHVDTIVVAPGGRVSLRPGGLHVMLLDLKGPLQDGGRLSLTLSFAGAGDMTVEVPIVRNPPPAAGDPRH